MSSWTDRLVALLPAVFVERWGPPRPVRFAEEFGEVLIELARASIERGLGGHEALTVDPYQYPRELRAKRSTFTTLKKDGQLRGCIGTLDPRRPLISDVAWSAYSAAYHDTRFPPLEREEYDGLTVEISILEPLREIHCESQDKLLAGLRPGVDGLVIRDSQRQASFLPSVWKGLPEPERFLAELKLKAGFTADHWSPDMRAWAFEVEEVGEG